MGWSYRSSSSHFYLPVYYPWSSLFGGFPNLTFSRFLIGRTPGLTWTPEYIYTLVISSLEAWRILNCAYAKSVCSQIHDILSTRVV